MRRTSWLLIGAGACVLAFLVALLQLVKSEPSSTATTSSRDDDAPAQQTVPNSAPPVERRGGAPLGKRRIGSTPIPMPSGTTTSPTQVDGSADEPRVDTENLHYGGTQLRTQTNAVEPLVKKCLDAEVQAGRSPTGSAVLTYIVAKHGDKFVVEDVGVDDEGTTLKDETLLACLRETSRAMQFVGLPKNAVGLAVKRRVSCDGGKLTENKHVGFSYLY
jgi:hypothetical protein